MPRSDHTHAQPSLLRPSPPGLVLSRRVETGVADVCPASDLAENHAHDVTHGAYVAIPPRRMYCAINYHVAATEYAETSVR